jgi:hypothetical protein
MGKNSRFKFQILDSRIDILALILSPPMIDRLTEWQLEEYKKKKSTTWYRFLKHLDMGIELDLSSIRGRDLIYHIKDEKKWLLARLKYGI